MATGVFDVLGFIECRGGKDEGLVVLRIAPEKSVAGNDPIMGWNSGEVVCSSGALERKHAEFWAEEFCFAAPIPDK